MTLWGWSAILHLTLIYQRTNSSTVHNRHKPYNTSACDCSSSTQLWRSFAHRSGSLKASLDPKATTDKHTHQPPSYSKEEGWTIPALKRICFCIHVAKHLPSVHPWGPTFTSVAWRWHSFWCFSFFLFTFCVFEKGSHLKLNVTEGDVLFLSKVPFFSLHQISHLLGLSVSNSMSTSYVSSTLHLTADGRS